MVCFLVKRKKEARQKKRNEASSNLLEAFLFRSSMKKELSIMGIVFLILTLGMHHKEWFSHPIEHIMNLPSAGAYGIGFIHPLVFTVLVYLILWIPRGAMKLFKGNKKGLK